MTRPAVLVLASPLDQVAIAEALRARGTYEVLVPDLAQVDWQPDVHVDGILSSFSIDRDLGVPTVMLPAWPGEPIKVMAQGITVAMKVSTDDPLNEGIDALDGFVLGNALTPLAAAI